MPPLPFLVVKYNMFKMRKNNKKMTWDFKTKEKIQYIFAGMAFVFGLALIGTAAWCIEPLGVVDATIITIFGLILSFIGAVFGLNLHYSNELMNFKTQAREEMDRFENEVRKKNKKNDEEDNSDN